MFKKLGSKLKEQKGFTLIELLAVIVILGIIAAIAIPAISNVINKSETKSQAQEGLQIISAAKLYVANEDFKLSSTVADNDLDEVKLAEYLDRTEDPTFIVTVSKNNGTGGGFTYTLKGHTSTDANGDDKIDSGEEMDEDELLKVANGK
jgi:type IV pilus assembly protein PilA